MGQISYRQWRTTEGFKLGKMNLSAVLGMDYRGNGASLKTGQEVIIIIQRTVTQGVNKSGINKNGKEGMKGTTPVGCKFAEHDD